MTTKQWAEKTFGEAKLGDERRTRRLVEVATTLGEHPSGLLNEAMPNWSQLKAAYRLLACDQVTYQAITQPHFDQVRQACRQAGHYLLLEDNSELDFSEHWATSGLGRIGNDQGRGFLIHSTLAYQVEAEGRAPEAPLGLRLLGLLDQQVWRREEPARKGKERKAERLARPRESEHWAAALAGAGPLPYKVRWTYIADRESDIYEVFARRLPEGCDFIIRCGQPRKLATQAGSVLEAVAAASRLGYYDLEVRTRPDQPARLAHLEVRARPVTLAPPWRPGRDKLEPTQLWVVQVREVRVAPGCTPLCWVLLSSHPCRTLEEALWVVRLYGCRWQIEEYHKALKSGTKVEQSQLSQGRRLMGLLGILALVAVRLLGVKYLAQGASAAPLAEDLRASEILAILESRVGKPQNGWDNRELIRAVAKLGGFLGRKGDGEPGWQTIWRGWSRLMDMALGYELATSG
jgi:hypothetical protein